MLYPIKIGSYFIVTNKIGSYFIVTNKIGSYFIVSNKIEPQATILHSPLT
jgi:hypothetical protein